MIILLIRGATLSGAKEGVEFFIIPDFDRLGDIDVSREVMYFMPLILFGLYVFIKHTA